MKSTPEVIAALGLAARPLSAADCALETCPREFPERSFDAAVEITLGGPDHQLVFHVDFVTGSAVVRPAAKGSKSAVKRSACFILPDGGRALVELLRRTFPRDKSLAAIEPCVASSDSLEATASDFPAESSPEVLNEVAAEYPESARGDGRTGTVVLQAWIDKKGTVRETMIRHSQGFDLDAAAVRALEQWTFRPATVGGKPVEVWITVPIAFGGVVEDIDIGDGGGGAEEPD